MPTKNPSRHHSPFTIHHSFLNWWLRRRLWQQILAGLLALFILGTIVMYATAQYYIAKHKNEPMTWGVTFIPYYAQNLGVEPKEAMQAMIDDLGIRRFRLVSYWSEHEKERGQYDFSELDWQFQKAEAAGAKVSLSIGLRQPRWPECHMPAWAARLTKPQWTEEVKKYMKVVIERYQNSPALIEYQLENEYFMQVFGICPDHSRERLIEEYNFVKPLVGDKPIVISRSNNWIGLPLGQPRPDKFGISVYKRVWDKTVTKRYFEYPLTDWFYGALAGGAEILTGRDMIIHELQAEPWLPPGFEMNDPTDLPEHNKSMDAPRLKHRLGYAKGTGMRTIDMWGAEYWYWRKVKAGDSSLWEVVKEEVAATKLENSKLLSD